ncbi:MAG: hypothetical protein WAM14_06135 [Candidatus Nitrosopolaris sp.]
MQLLETNWKFTLADNPAYKIGYTTIAPQGIEFEAMHPSKLEQVVLVLYRLDSAAPCLWIVNSIHQILERHLPLLFFLCFRPKIWHNLS